MYTDTEGIILKQVKTVNGRRMVLLFSKKYGKISGGTSINEKGRSKSALAMRPFTYGRYELYKNRDSYNINGAEVIKSYYRIGEDVDKYLACSYIMEFTEKMLVEDAPAPGVFNLLLEYLDIMERRTKKYTSLMLAYMVKALQGAGTMPQVNNCVICGCKDDATWFSVKDGGIICDKCNINIHVDANESLIYKVNFGIVNILTYFMKHPLKSFENLALDEQLEKQLWAIIKSYISYHLDIRDLKSECFLIEGDL